MRGALLLVLAAQFAGCSAADAGSLSIGAGSGATSSGTTYSWSGLYRETTPHAHTTYFESAGAGAPTDWTEWDEGTPDVTVSVDSTGLKLLMGSAGSTWRGVFRTAPSGTNRVAIHLAGIDLAVWDSISNVGVFMAEDLSSAPATGNFIGIYAAPSTADFRFYQDTDYASAGTNLDTDATWVPTPFLAVCYDGSNYIGLHSADGNSWSASTTRTYALAGVNPPASVAIAAYGVSHTAHVDMYRVNTVSTFPDDCFAPLGDRNDGT